MLTFLKSSAIALALLGTAMGLSAPACADGFAIDINSNNGHRGNNVIGFDFGNVAFAYRDGYWDNAHRWHRWRNAREHRSYRQHYSGGYRNWNHDRDGGDGWQRDRRDDRRDRRGHNGWHN
jgi:hypothetical protein